MKLSHTQNKLKIHHDEQVLSEQTSMTHVQEEDYRGFTPNNQTVEIERNNSVQSVSKKSDVKIITQKNNVTKIIEKTSKVTSVYQQSVTSSAKQELHQVRGGDLGMNKNAARAAKMSRHSNGSEDQSEVVTSYVNADYGIEQTGPDQIVTYGSQNSKNGNFNRSRKSVDQNPKSTISDQQSVFGHIQQNGVKGYQAQSAYHLNTRKSAHTTLDNEIEPVKAKNLSIKHVQFSSKSPGSVFKGGDNISQGNVSQGTGFTAQYPIQGSIPDYGVERRTTTAQANGDRRSMKMQLLQAKDGYSSSGLTTITQNQKMKHRFSHSLDQKTEMSKANQQYTHGYGFKEKDSTHESQKMQSSKSMSAQTKGVNFNTHDGRQPHLVMAQQSSNFVNSKHQSKLPQVMKVHVVQQQKAKKESHQYISLPKQVVQKSVLPQIDQSYNEYVTSSVQANEFTSDNQNSSAQGQNYNFVAEVVIPHKVSIQGKIRQTEQKKSGMKQKMKPPSIKDVHHRARISKQIDNDNLMTKSSLQTQIHAVSKNDTGYGCDSSAQVLDSESQRYRIQHSMVNTQSGVSSSDPQNFKVVCRNIREQLDNMVQTMDDMQNQYPPSSDNLRQSQSKQQIQPAEPPQTIVRNRDMTNIMSTNENEGTVTMQDDTSRFMPSDQVEVKMPQIDEMENNHDQTDRYEEMLKKGNYNINKAEASITADKVSLASNSSSQGQHMENQPNMQQMNLDSAPTVQYGKDKKDVIIQEAIEINVKSTNNIEHQKKLQENKRRELGQRMIAETQVIETVKLPLLNIEKGVMIMSPIALNKKKLEAELVDKSMQVTQDGERTFELNEFACQTSEIVQEQPEYNLTTTKVPLFNITANVDSEHNNTRKLETANLQAGSDIFNIQSVKQKSVKQKYSSKELLGPESNISQKNKNARQGPITNLFDKSSAGHLPSQSNDLGEVSRDHTAVSNQRRQYTLEQGSSPGEPRSTTSELYTADALYHSRNQHRPTVQELKKQKVLVQRNRGATQQTSPWLAEDSVFSKAKKPQQQPRGRKHGASLVFGQKKSMHQSYYTSVGHARQRSLQQSSNASDQYLPNDYEATPPLNPFGKKSRMVKRVRNSVHADQRDPGSQYNLYPGKPLHSRKRDRFYGSLENRPLLLEPCVQVHASRFAESYHKLKGQEQGNAGARDGTGALKGLLYVPGARGSGERRVVQNQYHQQIFDGEINAVNINIQQNNTLDNDFTMGSVSNPNLTAMTTDKRVPEIAIKGMNFETNQKKKAVNARTQTRGSAEPNMNLMENFEIQQVKSDGSTHPNGAKTNQNTTQRNKASEGTRPQEFTCGKKKSQEIYEDNTRSSNNKKGVTPFQTVEKQLTPGKDELIQVKEVTDSRNLVSHTRTLSKQSLNHSKHDDSEDEHDRALEMVDRIQKEQQKQEQLKKAVEEGHNQSKRQQKHSKLDTNSFKTEVTKKIAFDRAIFTEQIKQNKKVPPYGFQGKISPVVPQTTISEKVGNNKPSSVYPPKPSTPFIMEVTQTHDAFDEIVPKIEVKHEDNSTSIQLMYNTNSPPRDKYRNQDLNHVVNPAREVTASKENSTKIGKRHTGTNIKNQSRERTDPTTRRKPTDPKTIVHEKDEISTNTNQKNQKQMKKSSLKQSQKQNNQKQNERQDQQQQTSSYAIQMPQQDYEMQTQQEAKRNDRLPVEMSENEETNQTYYVDIPEKREQRYQPDSSMDLEERNLVQQRQKVMTEKDRIIFELDKLEKVKKKVENEKVQQHREIIQQEKERLNQEYLELNHLKDLLTIRKQELDELQDVEIMPYYSDDQQNDQQDQDQDSQYTYTWRSYSSYEDDATDAGGQATKPRGDRPEISIKHANVVVPRIMIPQGSGKQQSTTQQAEEGKVTQRVDVFQGLFDWAQSIIMTDLRNQQQKFLVRDKNGQPSQKLFTEGDIYQYHEQFKSRQVKEEDLPRVHKMGLRTMIELMKQLNQPEDVIEEMQQEITEENTFGLMKKCASLLMARTYVYKTLRNLLCFEKLVQQVRNDVEAYIECGVKNDSPQQLELHKSLMRKCIGDKSSQQIETNLTMISVQIIQDIAFMRDNFKLFEHMTAVSSKGHHVKNVMAYRRRDAMRYVAKKYLKVKKLLQLINKQAEKKAGNSSVGSKYSSVLDISAQMPHLQVK